MTFFLLVFHYLSFIFMNEMSTRITILKIFYFCITFSFNGFGNDFKLFLMNKRILLKRLTFFL